MMSHDGDGMPKAHDAWWEYDDLLLSKKKYEMRE